MKNKKSIWDHLAQYKLEKLHIPLDNPDSRYHHFLPENKDNLLYTYKDEIWDFINSKSMKLHHSFNHLNSSQALALNFFYPFIVENKLNYFLQAIGIENDDVADKEFEKVVCEKEQTNFDFYIKLKSGRKIFIEVKYSEDAFGRAKDDLSHQQKYTNIYKTFSETIFEKTDNIEKIFFRHYQLCRNLFYVEHNKGDLFIIIYPSWNDSVEREAEDFKNLIKDSEYKNSIRLITWESLISELKKVPRKNYTKSWMSTKFEKNLDELMYKYFEVK